MKLTWIERITLCALFIGIIVLMGQTMAPKPLVPEKENKSLPEHNRVENILGLDELV
ncbi:MAG: hypothetical protein VKK59_02200 [Vampirovibrionales bacterium]|nr:hypothetical protein [Vampirovibrionales bacterium]